MVLTSDILFSSDKSASIHVFSFSSMEDPTTANCRLTQTRARRSSDKNAIYDEINLPAQLMFNDFLENWHKERGATSFISEMAMCPSYQKIIGMGDKVVPLIFRQLEIEGDEPDMWFWALRAITSADPVTDDMRGNMVKMAEAWLNWGRSKYVW